ncbi:hypothetical protein OPV22_033696 [Ensete ventricosum]|uniref:E2 ubiquitin-conjugating enzyme n=1 Tax=Ensete ventricosum TaxID=4639 RepID=A0AAV8Q0T5_ENSVE|nr:hypothetical protein OPV22_033696 [Ensete ventricosum]
MVFASLSKLRIFLRKSSAGGPNVTAPSSSSASSSSQQLMKKNPNSAGENTSKSEKKTTFDDEIDMKYRLFKQFDVVQDHSDHYYKFSKLKRLFPLQPTKDWVRWIQHEWKILENDLPETIYVRTYEDRMDILRAVIVGPAGTPYHDGLFFFDIFFPPIYPQQPPEVYYRSGGLRINPNLYDSGRVCLSLLNTWSGEECEKWIPYKSSMLQVLVSIQALVLNAEPFFNEPAYAKIKGTPGVEKRSLVYNQGAFVLSCRTMLSLIRHPPKHFEDFVAGHFRKHGGTILKACRAYMNGVQVGCTISQGINQVVEGSENCSLTFWQSLEMLSKELLNEFTRKGADCSEFLAPDEVKN